MPHSLKSKPHGEKCSRPELGTPLVWRSPTGSYVTQRQQSNLSKWLVTYEDVSDEKLRNDICYFSNPSKVTHPKELGREELSWVWLRSHSVHRCSPESSALVCSGLCWWIGITWKGGDGSGDGNEKHHDSQIFVEIMNNLWNERESNNKHFVCSSVYILYILLSDCIVLTSVNDLICL